MVRRMVWGKLDNAFYLQYDKYSKRKEFMCMVAQK